MHQTSKNICQNISSAPLPRTLAVEVGGSPPQPHPPTPRSLTCLPFLGMSHAHLPSKFSLGMLTSLGYGKSSTPLGLGHVHLTWVCHLPIFLGHGTCPPPLDVGHAHPLPDGPERPRAQWARTAKGPTKRPERPKDQHRARTTWGPTNGPEQPRAQQMGSNEPESKQGPNGPEPNKWAQTDRGPRKWDRPDLGPRMDLHGPGTKMSLNSPRTQMCLIKGLFWVM